MFYSKLPEYVNGDSATVLKKGYDILLRGEAKKVLEDGQVTTFAMQPPNFIGLSPIPKMLVDVGDEVKAGDPLFFDKKKPEILFVAPVSGEIVAINRGQKRSIAEVVILADKEMKFREFKAFDLEKESREDLVNFLLDSGGWTLLRQRPFDILPNPKESPANIFISTFDTAPLAPDLNFVVEGKESAFQKGLDVLNKLTEGKVWLGLDARGKTPPSSVFTNASGVEKHWFRGKHPAGNVGVQIHHLAPINHSSKVWVLGVQEVITLGNLFAQRHFDAERIVALTGSELLEPKYVKTWLGANINFLGKDNLKGDKVRIISGDVLSGTQKHGTSFLNFYDDQLTAIPEGDYFEIFGWLLPLKLRPSISRTYLNFIISKLTKLKYEVDTNTHGEKRAFVVTGQYESVLPMDIYPQHLMKAILVNDYERMEGLGLRELVEEDVALCEFVCTSKQPLQQILRRGLDMLQEQG